MDVVVVPSLLGSFYLLQSAISRIRALVNQTTQPLPPPMGGGSAPATGPPGAVRGAAGNRGPPGPPPAPRAPPPNNYPQN